MADRLFIFNPDCEMAIASGQKYYMPPASIALMAAELSWLPAYMAANGDCVLASRLAGADFIAKRKYILRGECREITMEELDDIRIKKVEPWGWSPRVCHQFRDFPGVEEWTLQRKELYSRKKARECLNMLISALPSIEARILPQVCKSITDVENRVMEGDYIVKAPWSSSGKGLLFLRNGISSKEKEWINGVLRRQGYIMVEVRLDKVYDFAMEFYSDGKKQVEFIGLSAFYIGANGEYKGNYVGPQKHIENRLVGHIGENSFYDLKTTIIKKLSDLLSPYYKGYLGVDMMIYRNQEGTLKVHPCIEINLRYNMGILAYFLSKKIEEKAEGIFSIDFYPNPPEAYRKHMEKEYRNPLVYKNNKIVGGYINLTPVYENTKFVASLQVNG